VKVNDRTFTLNIISWTKERKAAVMIIATAFLLSRVLAYSLGVTFYSSFIHRLWQAIDIQLLSENLIESIFYSHSQPPLFNLIVGLIVKIFGPFYAKAFQIFQLCLSLATSLILYLTLDGLGVKRYISIAITIFFVLSPVVILYENLFSYTILVIFLIVCLIHALAKFFARPTLRGWYVVLFIGLLIVFTRSSFHLVWYVALGVLCLTLNKSLVADRKVLASAFFFLLLATSWYLKNQILYNSFSSSTWLGMSMARVMPANTPLGRIGAFKALEMYSRHRSFSKDYSQVEVLHNERKNNTQYINFNHIDYISLSKKFQAEVLEEIKSNPSEYVHQVGTAFTIYFNPASLAPFIDKNFNTLGWYGKVLTLHFRERQRFNVNAFTTTAALPAFVLYLVLFVAIVSCWLMGLLKPSEKAFIVVLLFVQAYGMLVGNLFELGENNRFRFETLPIIMILLALSIDRICYFFNRRNADSKV
jgi:hypothetical protein